MGDKLSFRNIVWSLVLIGSVISIALVIDLFLASFTIAVFLYYASRPLYEELRQRVQNDTMASFLTLIITFIPLLLFTGYIIQLGYTEVRRFLTIYQLPIRELIIGSPELNYILLLEEPSEIIQSQEGLALLRELMDWSITLVGFVGGAFIKVIITAVVFYYLLKHDEKLSEWARENFGSITPHWDTFWDKVDEDLHTIYFGNILNGIIAIAIATLIAVVYSLIAPQVISIPYPILFGVVAGITSLIPFIGVKLAYIPVTIYLAIIAYVTNPVGLLPYVLVFLIVTVIILDFLQDMLIRPYISGKHIHIGMLLVAYIAGPLLLGWYGFFLAPIALVLIYHFSNLILPDVIEQWFSHV